MRKPSVKARISNMHSKYARFTEGVDHPIYKPADSFEGFAEQLTKQGIEMAQHIRLLYAEINCLKSISKE